MRYKLLGRSGLRVSELGLGTDYVDLLWLHAWDFLTPVDEVMRGLDDLVRAGKVLYVGISDTPAWIVSQANTLADLRGWSPFVALTAEQMDRLDRATRIDLGFPHEFLAREYIRTLTHADTWHLIDNHRVR